ncbi:MAG: hypothetical protein IKZ69_03515 [Lachnospiraceae bacterium]|nr:hypothetical protein [Lachnospiraceae bacterium]
MRDQFRLERYEMQLFVMRHICVFLILYSIALLVYLHRLFNDSIWLMLLGTVAVVVLARLVAGFFSGMILKKNRKGHELVFLPLGAIIFVCYAYSAMREYDMLSWVELILLVLFLGLNIYAMYLVRYIRFVESNRDADYMAVYHVTIGNLRAYRLWYLSTILLVLSVAILPIWGPFNRFWANWISKMSSRLNAANQGGGGAITPVPVDVTPTPDISGAVTEAAASGSNQWIVTVIYIVLGAFIIFATVQMARIMLTKITDSKTSMETDRIIDLKKAIMPIQDEVIRVRDDSVIDENAYARRIRRTFKRAVFDRFGDVDIPEKTPEELLGTGRPQETDDILLEKYEKARYSNIPCTQDDVKAIRPQK